VAVICRPAGDKRIVELHLGRVPAYEASKENIPLWGDRIHKVMDVAHGIVFGLKRVRRLGWNLKQGGQSEDHAKDNTLFSCGYYYVKGKN